MTEKEINIERASKLMLIDRINRGIVNCLLESNKALLCERLSLSEEEWINIWTPGGEEFFTLEKIQEVNKLIFGGQA
jgi:hypothetical protein